MANSYAEELKTVQAAIRRWEANGGADRIGTMDKSISINVKELKEREASLKRLIRLQRGSGRNYIGGWM